MTDPAHDFLTGGSGAATVKFDNVGDKIVGRILKHELVQQKDFQSGALLFWDDGQPRMQAVVTLQAEEWTPEDQDDEGQRRLFVKGQMQKAVRDAIAKSKHKGSLIGGRLGVVYAGDGQPPRPGMNAPKQFTAKFEAPAAIPERDETGDPGPEEPSEEPF